MLLLYDPLAIIALVVSVASAIFVLMKEGTELLIGFRESAETSSRRKEIDAKLRAEVKKKEQDIIKTLTEKNAEEELETLVDLGQSAFYARSITTRLLERMTQRMGSTIGFVSMTMLVFFIAMFQGLNADITNFNIFVPFSAFAILAIILLYFTTKMLRGYYMLRERFLRLGENTTLAYCKQLTEELRNENIW